MLALNRRIEAKPGSRGSEAHPELDVFDRWSLEVLVEAVDAAEDATADGPKTSPEGRCGALALVMNMVVEKVSEVRYDAGRSGRIVIRAEDGIEIRVVV